MPILFSDVSQDWRINPSHKQTSGHLSAITETLGSGICALDANQDGWIDIFFVGGSGHTRQYGKKSWWLDSKGDRLLLNHQGKHFIDATSTAGLSTQHHGMGCAVADLDNDGFSDLLVTGIDSNSLYRGIGNGQFKDVSSTSGILNEHWSTGAALGDFNADGLIDIYLTNYVLYNKKARTFEANSGFKATKNIHFDHSLYNAEPNRLYINQGELRFTDLAIELNVSNPSGRSLGAKWLDINDDKWLDLIVINDHSSSNKLFLNNKGKSFTSAGNNYAPFEIDGAHDLQVIDFNNNGHDDYLMTRGNNYPTVLLSKKNHESSTVSIDQPLFSDIARAAGITSARNLPFMSWAVSPGDFNNDGFQDFYISNGSTVVDIDSKYMPLGQANQLYINNGNGRFINQQAMLNPLHPYSSRGSISVDLDNDGVLEILVTNNNNQLQVLKNINPTKNWIGLDFSSNTDVTNYAARITAITTENDSTTLYKNLFPPQSFLSQSDPRILIGLGDADSIKQLIIKWNDDTFSKFSNLAAGYYYKITKSNGKIEQLDNSDNSGSFNLSTFVKLSDEVQDDLISILLSNPDDNRELITILWQQSANRTKVNILNHINKTMDTRLFYLVIKALTSANPDILLQAIKISRKAELETTVSRLIPLLQNSDESVQCNTAKTFQFFFDEEEAVIQRKMLALSPLIKLLKSANTGVAICAANALSSAERQRAVLPLLQQLELRKDKKLKAAIIRALGLIRDTRSIKPLQKWVTALSSPPEIVGAGLIALSRLNDPQLPAFLDHLANSPGRAIFKRFDILTYIFENSEGITLPFLSLKSVFHKIYSLNKSNTEKNSISMLNTIRAGRLDDYEEEVLYYINHKNNAISYSAINTLASLGTSSSIVTFENTLLKLIQTGQVRILLLPELIEYPYSSHFIKSLSEHLISQLEFNPTGLQNILDLLNSLSPSSASILFNYITSIMDKEEQLLPILKTCSERILSVQKVQPLLKSPNPSVRIAYVDCLLGSKFDHNKVETFKLRSILKDILRDDQIDEEKRIDLMIKFAAKNNTIAKTFLFKKLPQLPFRLRLKAIAALRHIELIPATENYLWNLLNHNKSPNIQVKSALVLNTIDTDQVREHILKEFFH